MRESKIFIDVMEDFIKRLSGLAYYMDGVSHKIKSYNDECIKSFLIKEDDLNQDTYEIVTRVFGLSLEELNDFKNNDEAVLLSNTPSIKEIRVHKNPNYPKIAEHYQCIREPIFSRDDDKVAGLLIEFIELSQNKDNVPVSGASKTPNIAQSRKVLLLEPDMTKRNEAKAYFEAMDIHVDAGDSERMALEMIGNIQYALIMTEIDLTGGASYSLSKKIRKLELGKEATHIPIIAFTTYEPKVVADSCKSFGMDAVMRSEDLNFKVIRQIIDAYVDGKDIVIPALLKTSDYNFTKTLEKKS